MESKFFTEAISRRRIAADLTQDALAQKAGINRTTYGSIERGQRALSNENLVRLSIALGARVEDILGEAYKVQYVALLEIEPEVRKKMGIAPREGEKNSQNEPQTAIDSFVSSLRNLLLIFQPQKEPAADFLVLTPAPPTGEAGKPRRRARSSRPRKPQRR